jgi:hypothetical protein
MKQVASVISQKIELSDMVVVNVKFLELKLNSVALVRERTIPTERPPLVGEVLVLTFADRGCRVVSATDSHVVVNLGFLDRSRYFFLSSSSSLVLSRG